MLFSVLSDKATVLLRDGKGVPVLIHQMHGFEDKMKKRDNLPGKSYSLTGRTESPK